MTNSNLLMKAFEYATIGHAGELKKMTKVNYLYHPMAVAALVFKFGGNEEQAAAALIHDLIDDRKKSEITDSFGQAVSDLAFSFMDPPGMADKNYKEKKSAYIEKISEVGDSAFLVIACEEFHDGSELVFELKTHGAVIWERYDTQPSVVLWYYVELFNLISKKFGEESPLSQEFFWIISELQVLVDTL